jgi:hypothetical protein
MMALVLLLAMMIPVVLSTKTGSTSSLQFLIRHEQFHRQWKPLAKSIATSMPTSKPLSSLESSTGNIPTTFIGHYARRQHHDDDDDDDSCCLLIRGGGADAVMTTGQQQQQAAFAAAGTSIVLAITKLTDYIAATKLRCWTVLGIAILIEIAATTLLNVATLKKSPTKLAIAMIMYMTR